MATTSRTPQRMIELADIAGWDAAHKLVRFAGGQNRLIPQEAPAEHWLCFVVGPEAAAKICKHYGGDVLAIPKNDAELLAWRYSEIRRKRQEGATIRQLAHDFNLTERWIYVVLGGAEG